MSYLISLAAQKIGENTYKCGDIGSFGGMSWYLGKDKPSYIRFLNKQVLKAFEDPACYYVTTEEKLKTAPVDEVILIIDEDHWERLEHKPVNNIKGRPLSEFL